MKVNCLHSELVPLHKLVPNPRNPNKHPEAQIALLAKIIDYTGWRWPIKVSKRSGFIVSGHARLMASQKLGYSEAPVEYQDYEDEAQEWADLIADNRLGELAEIDRPMHKDILQELDTGGFDMETTGYTEQAIEELMTAYRPDDVGSELPPSELAGEDTRNGYYILLIKIPSDREFWARKLGLADVPPGNKVIMVKDVGGDA